MRDVMALPARTTGGLRELALFAGIGGGLLGTRLLGWTVVCAVEKEPYRREVLLRRQRDGVFPMFPIWNDIKTFTTSNNACRRTIKAIRRCRPLVITAGFPCQPFSIAGKQLGEADERNLWPETIRVIREIRPDFCFLENVPQLVRHDYFGVILGDLAEAGFDAEWGIVSAADVGAPHIRKRLWILAYAKGVGWETRWESEPCRSLRESKRCCGKEIWGEWPFSSESIRMANGVPNRMDRIAGSGCAQVPAVVALAWNLLSGEIKRDRN